MLGRVVAITGLDKETANVMMRHASGTAHMSMEDSGRWTVWDIPDYLAGEIFTRENLEDAVEAYVIGSSGGDVHASDIIQYFDK